VAEAQRKTKAGPSALDPVMAGSTPMQETKGKSTKKKKSKLPRAAVSQSPRSHHTRATLAFSVFDFCAR
jgi:hypothetical protein